MRVVLVRVFVDMTVVVVAVEPFVAHVFIFQVVLMSSLVRVAVATPSVAMVVMMIITRVAVRMILVSVAVSVAVSVMAMEPWIIHVIIFAVLVFTLVRVAVAAPIVAVIVASFSSFEASDAKASKVALLVFIAVDNPAFNVVMTGLDALVILVNVAVIITVAVIVSIVVMTETTMAVIICVAKVSTDLFYETSNTT